MQEFMAKRSTKCLRFAKSGQTQRRSYPALGRKWVANSDNQSHLMHTRYLAFSIFLFPTPAYNIACFPSLCIPLAGQKPWPELARILPLQRLLHSLHHLFLSSKDAAYSAMYNTPRTEDHDYYTILCVTLAYICDVNACDEGLHSLYLTCGHVLNSTA
jgi:hypothetical protein